MARKKNVTGTLNMFGETVKTVTEDDEKKKRATAEKPKVEYVYCGECVHFNRDTYGMNRDIHGIYFMGVCAKGIHTDTPRKQFSDKPRLCETYKPKTT